MEKHNLIWLPYSFKTAGKIISILSICLFAFHLSYYYTEYGAISFDAFYQSMVYSFVKILLLLGLSFILFSEEKANDERSEYIKLTILKRSYLVSYLTYAIHNYQTYHLTNLQYYNSLSKILFLYLAFSSSSLFLI